MIQIDTAAADPRARFKRLGQRIKFGSICSGISILHSGLRVDYHRSSILDPPKLTSFVLFLPAVFWRAEAQLRPAGKPIAGTLLLFNDLHNRSAGPCSAPTAG